MKSVNDRGHWAEGKPKHTGQYPDIICKQMCHMLVMRFQRVGDVTVGVCDVNHFASCLGEVPSCKWGQYPPKPCVMDALGLEQQHSELFTQSV